ncbi:MAG: aminotransferase class V-fold PLP-dependent enzyme [Bacteroidales bacterium]|nr:aminotransferase class V-fold PLP-dependent enzyme [Bacteroidales bacterium]
MKTNPALTYAQSLDAGDPLIKFRHQFRIDDPKLIYLDGNSLGRLPVGTLEILNNVVDYQWGNRLIRSWNEGWYELASRLGSKLAPIIGAQPGEVIFTDSTSQNLFKLITGALRFQPEKLKIVSDVFNFPSDIYLLQGVNEMFGKRYSIVLAGNPGAMEMDYEELFNAIDEKTALVTLSLVVFKSAFMYNMKRVTEYAHSKGALVLWDLSHAAGAVAVRMNDCNADLATGCSYKYLNGGPGAPAFLYVREDLQEKIPSPVWGWFGEENPFEFGLNYRPAKGIRKFLAGSPPVLSLSAIEPALDIILEAGIDNIREKSIKQTEYLLYLAGQFLFPLGFSSGSPIEPEKRGSHISLRHPDAFRICKALVDPDIEGYSVIPDFREPDNIRLGITALYTSYEEIYMAVKKMEVIAKGRQFLNYPEERDAVT